MNRKNEQKGMTFMKRIPQRIIEGIPPLIEKWIDFIIDLSRVRPPLIGIQSTLYVLFATFFFPVVLLYACYRIINHIDESVPILSWVLIFGLLFLAGVCLVYGLILLVMRRD